MGKFDFLNNTNREKFYKQGLMGQEQVIAVIDTGVSEHEQLNGRLLSGISVCDYTDSYKDDNGHGTHCAGIVAGSDCGIAPKALILPIKVVNQKAGGNSVSILKGMEYALEWRGEHGERVSVVSCSLSISEKGTTEKIRNDMQKAIAELIASDIPVVVASGNYGASKLRRYPACFDEPIVVASVDDKLKLAASSSIRDEVDFCQVGVKILGCAHENPRRFVQKSGTSMATPLVAGMCALLKQKGLSEKQVYTYLKVNAVELGLKGRDPMFGWGFAML